MTGGGGGKAAPPDFTKGDPVARGFTHDWNLGPTGARGWIHSDQIVTTGARQILITGVDPPSPDAGAEPGDLRLEPLNELNWKRVDDKTLSCAAQSPSVPSVVLSVSVV
jgi:hypothetical protein